MRQKKRRPQKPKVRRTLELTVAELGAQGDGIAQTPDGPVYVPGALAGDSGEAVIVGNRAESFVRHHDGPGRRAAPCPHFDSCGGCTLQHLEPAAYQGHKRALFEKTFRTADFGAGQDVAPVTFVAGAQGTRRRTTFRARGRGKGALLGYQKAGSHKLTPIDQCLVLTPTLAQALADIRQLASSILRPGEEAVLSVTEYDNGLDISIVLESDLYEDRRLDILAELGAAAQNFNIARITVNNEPALTLRTPAVSFAGVTVHPPHNAFLQPGKGGEETLRRLVMEACPERANGRAVDLFAGCGTFTFSLAHHFDVVAYESEVAQVLALQNAATTSTELNVEAIRRDLFREPLGDLELRKVDYAVLNPPRAGARTQVEELAKSGVGVVTYVSCNPGTLARDAIILRDGGYHLKSVTVLDQFIYSVHSECVAVFVKA